MQLLPEFEMFFWILPSKWQNVRTGNLECVDYSVTNMDDAMPTRMLHFTMVYDDQALLSLANHRGLDQRVIARPNRCPAGKQWLVALAQVSEQAKLVDFLSPPSAAGCFSISSAAGSNLTITYRNVYVSF